MSSRKGDFSFCLHFCTFVTFVAFIPIVILPLALQTTITEVPCEFSNITYPTQLPTMSSTENWSECDCGRRCTAWSPCVNVILTSMNTTYIAEYQWYMTGSTNICTFHNTTCTDGEDTRYTQLYMEWAKEIAEEYYSSYSNITTCFKYNDVIYLSTELDYNWIIFSSVIFGIMLTCSAISCRNNSSNSNNSSNIEE